MHVLAEHKLVVGLDWALHESLKAAKTQLSKEKATWYARRVVGTDHVQAIIQGKPPVRLRGMRAGALAVSCVLQNAIVAQPVGEGKLWVCGIRDGMPLPGYDRVVAESEASALIAELMSYVVTAEIIGALPGATRSLDAVLKEAPKKCLQQTVFRSTSLLVPLAVLTVGGLVVAGVLMGVAEYQARTQKDQQAAAAALQRLMSEQARQQQEAEARRQWERKVQEAKAQVAHVPDPIAQLWQWTHLATSLPLSIGGWTPSRVECTPGECVVTWTRPDARAPLSTALGLPGRSVSVSANEATTAFALSPVGMGQGVDHGGAYALWFSDLPPKAAWLGQRVRMTVGEGKPVELKPEQEGLTPVRICTEHEWQLAFADLDAMKTFIGTLAFPGIAATSATIRIKNGYPTGLEFRGVYRHDG